MPSSVLILSCPQDYHSHAMCEALERKSARFSFFNTPDFPSQATLTIKPEAGGLHLVTRDATTVEDLGESTAVWLRRPFFGKAPEDFEADDRQMIERECREMRESFLDLLGRSAFWVNPYSSLRQERWKPSHLVEAQRCGLRIPATLVSNDPGEIVEFVQHAPCPVIYKSFNSLVSTSLLAEEMISDSEVLRWTPGIYQHYVEKDHELRVTVIGRRVFAVQINSQQTSRGRVDWRDAQWQPIGGASDLTFQPVALPKRIEQACLRLVRRLGLVYGAIDLIVTPERKYVFLEINPSGQFLWVEHETGLPLLDALAEMLIQGRTDYAWDEGAPGIRFDQEMHEATEERRARSLEIHVTELQR